MSSNYPPGVTGNEYQIAGPDREFDARRKCSSEGFPVMTITQYGKNNLLAAITTLHPENPNPALAVSAIRMALLDIYEADVEGACPFEGSVSVQQYQGMESWECPVCRVIHETEVE